MVKTLLWISYIFCDLQLNYSYLYMHIQHGMPNAGQTLRDAEEVES